VYVVHDSGNFSARRLGSWWPLGNLAGVFGFTSVWNFFISFGCCWCYIWLILKNGAFDCEYCEVKMTVDAIS